jgi:hypothetical protein
LAAVLGAVSGGVCGFFVSGQNQAFAALGAIVACLISVIFERFFITILAAALAAVFAFAVLAIPYIDAEQYNIGQSAEHQVQNTDEPLNPSQTIDTMVAFAEDFSGKVKQIFSQMPVYNWVIIAASVIIFMIAGFFLWRLTSALCCAAFGTLLVFCGLILLLLYKGSRPVSHIVQKPTFYGGILLAMIAFGTIVQFLFCQREKVKHKAKRQTDKDEQKQKGKFRDWRGS